MAAEQKRVIRCAIYTRKSSEEGLEQSFNSLDAQREACQAYIASQRHEGWRATETQYDDGGYSGGNIDRPALSRLLEDINAGKIDTVVVYKVDRLTRSLSDFAKIIESFDAHHVSFVSVTQQFNTTTSMGRLTLNVLLSFAQFEREVTGERIRDKIAASKRKGMWMGGMVPLGYDLKGRKLVVNANEAGRVLEIYRRYLQLGCVRKLKLELEHRRLRSKKRISKSGNRSGGAAYSRGALYKILQNRVYLGEITHRGQSYAGEHEGIVTLELWEKVQALLRSNNQARRNGTKTSAPSLLAGLVYDDQGNRFTPSHAVKKGKRYRYYVSQAVIQHRRGTPGTPVRIPAHEIEHLVSSRLQSFLASAREVADGCALASHAPSTTQALVAAARERSKAWRTRSPLETHQFLRTVISRVVVHEARLEVLVRKEILRQTLLSSSTELDIALPAVENPAASFLVITISARLKRCSSEVRLVLPHGSQEDVARRTMPSLLKAIARAHCWYEQLVSGKMKCQRSVAKQTGFDECYIARILPCAFLAPDIVEAILRGSQPPGVTLHKLLRGTAMNWKHQHASLGFLKRMD
jgi:site-specific DNA recombinase